MALLELAHYGGFQRRNKPPEERPVLSVIYHRGGRRRVRWVVNLEGACVARTTFSRDDHETVVGLEELARSGRAERAADELMGAVQRREGPFSWP